MRNTLTLLIAALLTTSPLLGCDETGGSGDGDDTGTIADTSTLDGDAAEDATSEDTSEGDATAEDTTTSDTSEGDTAGGDTSEGDTTVGDTSGGDITAGDTTAGDTTAGDTTAGDTTAGDTTAGDTAGGDTATDVAGDTVEPTPDDPADWSQCETNADCVDTLGWEFAYCNTDWPGGRCSCNGNASVDTCFKLGNGANTPVCHGDDTTGYFCTYEAAFGCPSWLDDRFFVGEDLCLPRTCSENSTCDPFVCATLDREPGGNTYCQSPIVLPEALPETEDACAAAGLVWVQDEACPRGGTCSDVSFCSAPCEADADCSGDRPFCRTRGLFQSSDTDCSATIQECTTTDANACGG